MQRQARNATTQSQPRGAADRQVGGGARATRAPLAGHGFADQEAMLAPGGSLDTALQANLAPSECGPDKQRYANPAPFGWSVDYRRRGLGEGHYGKGKKQKVHVEATYDWAMMNQSNKSPKVEMLQGKLTSVTTEGRKEVARETEEMLVSVDENGARFDKEVGLGERFALPRTKVKSKGPQRDAAAEIESCP